MRNNYNSYPFSLFIFPKANIPILKITDEIANNTLFHEDNMYLSNYAYSAELPSSWEEYKKKLTSKIKADSRRQYKRLAEKGELRFESIENGNKNMGKVLESFFEQKSKRYQATGAYDVLANKTVQNFYSEMPTELGKGVKTQLSALFLDNFLIPDIETYVSQFP